MFIPAESIKVASTAECVKYSMFDLLTEVTWEVIEEVDYCYSLLIQIPGRDCASVGGSVTFCKKRKTLRNENLAEAQTNSVMEKVAENDASVSVVSDKLLT